MLKMASHTVDFISCKYQLKQSIENPVDLKRFQKQENRNLNLTQR